MILRRMNEMMTSARKRKLAGRMKAAGVDGLAIIENAATVLRAAQQCNQQGFSPRELNVSATTGLAWQNQPAMKGTITTQPKVTVHS